MGLDDSLRDREPEAGARRRRLVRAPEAVEHAREVLRGDADARVGDREAHRVAVPRRADRDAPARRREADGVRPEVREDLRQARAVRQDGRECRVDFGREGDSTLARERLERLDRRRRQLGRAVRRRLHRDPPGRDRRAVEQVHDQPVHLVRRPARDAELLPREAVRVVVRQQLLEYEVDHRPQRPERAPQVVREGGDHEVACREL